MQKRIDRAFYSDNTDAISILCKRYVRFLFNIIATDLDFKRQFDQIYP